MAPTRPPMRTVTGAGSASSDFQVLDSKINLMAQKISNMEKNEEIMGRTLIALNQKIKELESRAPGSGGKTGASENLDAKYATKQEVQELKFILDDLNPLEYATIDQVKELLEEWQKKLQPRK